MSASTEEAAFVPDSGSTDSVSLLSDVQFDWRIRMSEPAKERFRKMVLEVLRTERLRSVSIVAVVRRYGVLPAWDDLQIDVFDKPGTRICTLNSVKDVRGKIRLFA